MHPDDWYLTEDVDDFLARAGDFLRSRPALHTIQLTMIEKLRTRGVAAFGGRLPVFGLLERAGEVGATFYRFPPGGLSVTPLTPEEADSLVAQLVALGHSLPLISADHDTAAAFAEAWQRHAGATPTLRVRLHLYRLGALTPPEPFPAGRGATGGRAGPGAPHALVSRVRRGCR